MGSRERGRWQGKRRVEGPDRPFGGSCVGILAAADTAAGAAMSRVYCAARQVGMRNPLWDPRACRPLRRRQPMYDGNLMTCGDVRKATADDPEVLRPGFVGAWQSQKSRNGVEAEG